MMKKYIFIMLCALCLIAPAMSQSVSYNCPQGVAIYELEMIGGSPSTTTFTLHYQDSSTVSGSWSYQPYYVLGYPVATQATITLDGSSNSMIFVTPGQMHVSIYTGRNLTEFQESRLIMGAGQSGAVNNIAVQKYGLKSAIIGYEFSSDSTIEYDQHEQSLAAVISNLNSKSVLEIYDVIKGYWDTAYGIFTGLAYWLKFLFVDNLIMVVTLYITGTMAYAINTSRSIFSFYKTWFRQQSALFHFIANIFATVISIITQIVQSLKPV